MENKSISITDLYFLAETDDHIVVNDEYSGLIVLDKDLSIIRKIPVIEDLVIENAITKENKMLLFCYETECIVFVDLDSVTVKKIDLTIDAYFLPVFLWENDECILAADMGKTVVKLDLKEWKLTDISGEDNKLSVYIQKIFSKKVYGYCTEQNTVFVDNEGDVCLYNYIADTYRKTGLTIEDNEQDIPSYMSFHETLYIDDTLIRISETRVNIITADKDYFLYPHKENYRFAVGKTAVVNGQKVLYIISTDNSCEEPSVLTKYSF